MAVRRLLGQITYGGVEIPGLGANLGFALARLATGCMLALGHGLGMMPVSPKFIATVETLGFPQPVIFAWLAVLSQFVGGLLIALGLATRPAALFAGFTMGIAFFVQHAADPFEMKERAALYLSLTLVFLALGSGRFGVDRSLRRRF